MARGEGRVARYWGRVARSGVGWLEMGARGGDIVFFIAYSS